MPYKRNSELPQGVKGLPQAAQSIFRKIANAAIQQYGDVPEKVQSVAWAGLKKAGWAKDEQTGKWHKVQESDGDSWQDDEKIDAWLDRMLPDILAEADTDDVPATEPLTEDDDSLSGPGRALEHASELLACGTEVLSEDERGFLATMIARLAKDTATTPDAPDDAYMEAYALQGPRLAQDAYRALVSLSPSLDADGLPSLLESMKALMADDADVSPVEDVTIDQAKEALENLKIWDVRVSEAGQRHAAWEYKLIDEMIDMLKQLRGATPSEQKAQAAEDMASTPAAQMQAGYRESGPMDEQQFFLQESTLILQEREGSDGSEWEVSIIAAGLSKNGRRYALDVLRRGAHLFEGKPVYTYDRLLKGRELYDHLSEDELKANPLGYARDLVGYIKEPRIVGSQLAGTLVILDGADWLKKNLRSAFQRGKRDVYGLSIDAGGEGHWVETNGQKILEVDSIDIVRSVDVVTFPAAGGGFLRLVAGADPLAYDDEVVTLVEGLSKELQTMHFRVAMEDAFDEAEVDGAVRRRLRARLLAALPQ